MKRTTNLDSARKAIKLLELKCFPRFLNQRLLGTSRCYKQLLY